MPGLMTTYRTGIDAMPRPRKSTSIRNARKATAARKRAAFEFQTPNKKPGIAPGLYIFDATGTPNQRPGSELEPHTTEVLTHEIYS